LALYTVSNAGMKIYVSMHISTIPTELQQSQTERQGCQASRNSRTITKYDFKKFDMLAKCEY